MKTIVLALTLVLQGLILYGQKKAEEGTYQIVVSNAKHVQYIQLDDDMLKEIESERLEDQDKRVRLSNGIEVFVISQKSIDQGRRVLKWKLEG